MSRDIKKCPFCAEEIKADPKYCRFCHHDLSAQSYYRANSRPAIYSSLENEKRKRGEEDVVDVEVMDIPKQNNLQKKYLTSSLEYMEKKDYDHALKEINQFIGLNSGNAESYNIRGVVYQKSKNYYDALQDFQKAIELDPKDSRPYFNRALLNKELGERQSMIRFMVAAAKLGHKEAQEFLKLEGISW